MYRYAALAVFAAAGAFLSAGNTEAKPIAFTGVRLIDGQAARPIEDAILVIDGERIVAAGPRATVMVPPDAEIRDQRGRTILPGLVSNHSHVGIVKGLTVGPENYTRDNILAQLKHEASHEADPDAALKALGVVIGAGGVDRTCGTQDKQRAAIIQGNLSTG